MQWKKNQSDLQENVSVRVPFLSVCFLLLLVCMGVTAQTNYKISGTVAAFDMNPAMIGTDIGTHLGMEKLGITISDSYFSVHKIISFL